MNKINRHDSELKMIIWGNTAKGAKVYPLTRTDDEFVNAKFEQHLHSIMHRPGQSEF